MKKEKEKKRKTGGNEWAKVYFFAF